MNLALDLLFIFTLRMLDVGIGTVRIVLISRGRRAPAAALGFVEAMIWVIAVSRVLSGLEDPVRMVAFALGFAAGTYFGSMVEEWLALGQSLIRVVAPVQTDQVAPMLRQRGYGATVVNGDGLSGEVRVTFCIVPRKVVWSVTRLIHQANPEAYVSVEQTSTIDLAERHGGDVQK